MPRGLQLCYSDAYARSTEARVLAVQLEPSPAVLLDRTVFYPGGGGQPPDTGTLTRSADGAAWTVTSARKADGEIVHDLAAGEAGSSALPNEGDVATAEIDWPRRHLLMRTHTALHVLCGVVWRDYGAQVTGGTWSQARAGWTSSSSGCPATWSARSRRRSTPSSSRLATCASQCYPG